MTVISQRDVGEGKPCNQNLRFNAPKIVPSYKPPPLFNSDHCLNVWWSPSASPWSSHHSVDVKTPHPPSLLPKLNYAQGTKSAQTVLFLCATPGGETRWIICPASICHTDASNLTVRWGAGDRRLTLQQIAGLPGVVNLIKQMPRGITSEHQGGKVTDRAGRCERVRQPKDPG